MPAPPPPPPAPASKDPSKAAATEAWSMTQSAHVDISGPILKGSTSPIAGRSISVPEDEIVVTEERRVRQNYL